MTRQSDILRWEIENKFEKPAVKSDDSIEDKSVTDLKVMPDWLNPVEEEIIPPRPLTPSGVLDLLEIAPAKKLPADLDSLGALANGNAIHNLLQILPELPALDHEKAIEQYFNSSQFKPVSDRLDKTQREAISKTVLSLISHPKMSKLFGENSRAEMAITGKLNIRGSQRLIRGKIDRLAVLENSVIIADYKSGSGIPHSPSDVSFEYLAQMALYRKVVQPLYPNHQVEAWLIWTSNQSIMPLPEKLLEETFITLTKA